MIGFLYQKGLLILVSIDPFSKIYLEGAQQLVSLFAKARWHPSDQPATSLKPIELFQTTLDPSSKFCSLRFNPPKKRRLNITLFFQPACWIKCL